MTRNARENATKGEGKLSFLAPACRRRSELVIRVGGYHHPPRPRNMSVKGNTALRNRFCVCGMVHCSQLPATPRYPTEAAKTVRRHTEVAKRLFVFVIKNSSRQRLSRSSPRRGC